MLSGPLRTVRWICALAAAVALKWLFDEALWDPLDGLLARTMNFERAELLTAVLSYLLPLALAVVGYAMLFPGPAADDTRPVLRRHPWQSRRLIVGVLVVVVALIAGSSYGRVFKLPQISLPASGR